MQRKTLQDKIYGFVNIEAKKSLSRRGDAKRENEGREKPKYKKFIRVVKLRLILQPNNNKCAS